MKTSLVGFILVRDNDDPFFKIGPNGRDEDAPILYPPVRPVAKARVTSQASKACAASVLWPTYWGWAHLDGVK